jgi:hypothetical protein
MANQADTTALNNPKAGFVKAGFIKAAFIPVFPMVVLDTVAITSFRPI